MTTRTHCATLLLLISLLLCLPQCKPKDPSPPIPKAAVAPQSAATTCCDTVAQTGLKDGMGRIIVTYPPTNGRLDARLDVYRPGETVPVTGGYGNQAIVLPPAHYDISVTGRRITGVAVQAGRDTRFKVGVLHLNAHKNTRIDLSDPDTTKVITSTYGETAVGLPVGPVVVQIAGQTDTAMIEDGKVTEF